MFTKFTKEKNGGIRERKDGRDGSGSDTWRSLLLDANHILLAPWEPLLLAPCSSASGADPSGAHMLAKCGH